jgi:hypothetical protein
LSQHGDLPLYEIGAARRGFVFYQANRKPRSQLAERRGKPFSGPVAAGDLRRFDDAAVARRQTAPLGSLAITASKFRPPPQRRHRPCKPGKNVMNSRTHGCSPSWQFIGCEAPWRFDKYQFGAQSSP